MMRIEQKIHYILRLAVAMCFIGHGCFGIITKQIWCNYFAVFGIGKDAAYALMPWLGAFDILLGLVMLVYPVRAIALWLVIWGIFTALLRPASGEPFAEFIERAGNFGAPLALLILSGEVTGFRQLFVRIDPAVQADAKTLAGITACLKVTVFLLLAGHGWLNIIEKKGLIGQYTSIGFTHPGKVAQLIGVLEIAAAFITLFKPLRSLLLLLFVWKMASELFYPHYELFEWVERGGSYGAILALWIALKDTALTNKKILIAS